jgi:hypothetical protein
VFLVVVVVVVVGKGKIEGLRDGALHLRVA